MFVLVQILGGRSRDLTVFQDQGAGPYREALVSSTSPGLTQTTEAKSGHHQITTPGKLHWPTMYWHTAHLEGCSRTHAQETCPWAY